MNFSCPTAPSTHIKMQLARAAYKILKYSAALTLISVIISLWKIGGSAHYGLIISDHVRVELDDLEGLPQNDSFLIGYLRQHHLFPPSSREYRYSQLEPKQARYIRESSRRTRKIIQKYLKNKTNGVFVEALAYNGADESSNTLVLERDYNWTGLLVEGSPLVFPKLIAAHRKSWKSDVFLSKYPRTQLRILKQGPGYAGKKRREYSDNPVVVMAKDGKTPMLNFEVLTVPLYSLVAASQIDVIDFLSLDVPDVEGTELEILMNFPFEKVLIRTMTVEVNIMGKRRAKRLTKFLSSKGYRQLPSQPKSRDRIFIHKSVINN